METGWQTVTGARALPADAANQDSLAGRPRNARTRTLTSHRYTKGMQSGQHHLAQLAMPNGTVVLLGLIDFVDNYTRWLNQAVVTVHTFGHDDMRDLKVLLPRATVCAPSCALPPHAHHADLHAPSVDRCGR